MKAQLFISWRYLFTKRKEKFISLISVISILGVAIGVMALIIVLAVMAGFDNDLRDKIVGNYSHITVTSFKPITGSVYNSLREKIASNPEVTGVSPYVQGQVLIKDDKRYFAVNVKGIEPSTEKAVSKIDKYMAAGSLSDLGTGNFIIGKELAAYFGLKTGSSVTVYSPSGKKHELKVVGIFNSGMYDYDLHLVLMHIQAAQQIFEAGEQISAVAVKVRDMYQADRLRHELSASLGYDYMLNTWMEANENFFAALKLEKFTMFVILTLIVLVASFNIVSTLIVMVIEKTKDIGILKTIGMSSGDIRKIFTLEGIIIGALGTALGVLGGFSLCALLKKYQFIKLPQDIYYIDRLPVAVNWYDVSVIVIAAMLISLLATVYPAFKAAGLRPVEALRYE